MRKFLAFILILFVACPSWQPAFASEKIPPQEGIEEKTSSAAPAGDEEERKHYKIYTGDIIYVQVYQEQDLSGDFEVKEDGTISYPLLGSVKVVDTTIIEAEKNITALLEKDYLVNPFVRLVVRKYKRLQGTVMIMGAVPRPGSYTLPEDRPITLLQAISLAGGFTPVATVKGTKVVRTAPDKTKLTLEPEMDKILSGEKKDMELQAEDFIHVPERQKIPVMVMGSVQRPGPYIFPDDKPATLLQAISLAGGFTRLASVKKTKIIRAKPDGTKETLDPQMHKILSGDKKDIELQPDDLISVPERLF